MRWPFANWLRGAPGRDDPSPGASGAAAVATDPGAVAGPEPGPVASQGSPGGGRPPAWPDLPPVQRAVGAAPLTAPSADFARGLAGRRAPDPILAPLGHDVTADGPAGLVSGIAVPLVQRAAPSADHRPPPALPAVAPGRAGGAGQRAVASVAALPRTGGVDLAGAGSTPSPGATAAAPSAAATPDVDAAEDAGGAAHAAPPVIALRTLPVARLAIGTPALAATRVADTSAPPPVLALAHAVAGTSPAIGSRPGPERPASRSASEDRGPAAVDSPGAQPEPDARAAGTVTSPAADGGDAMATPGGASGLPVSGLPVVARRTLGESRRLGLGAPLAGLPPSLQRESAGSDLPVARRARPADTTALVSTGPLPGVAMPRVALPAMAAVAPRLPHLPVVRRPAASGQPGRSGDGVAHLTEADGGSAGAGPASSPGSSGGPAAGDDAAADGPGRELPAGPAGAARPLVGDLPIAVSRLVRGDAGEDAGSDRPADPAGAAQGAGEIPPIARAAAGVAAAAGGAAATGARGLSVPLGDAGGGVTGASAIGGSSGLPGRAPVQRSVATADRNAPSQGAGAASVRGIQPAVAPLVAGRAIRAGAAAAPNAQGATPSGEPALVVARLASPAWDTAADVPPNASSAADGSPFGDTMRTSTRPAVFGAPDARPVVARAALSAGRETAGARTLDVPRARATSASVTAPVATAATGDGGAGHDRAGGATLGWAAGAGFTTVASPPVPFVQRAVTIDEVSVTPGGDAAGAAQSGAAGAGGQAGGAGTDYEELAEHVYDKIRARLTTELLLDRERAGMLVDG